MISFDWSLYDMFFNDPVCRRDPVMRATLEAAKGFAELGNDTTELRASQLGVLKNARKCEKGAAQPKLGVEHMKEIAALDDHGLTWKWSCINDAGFLPPNDRVNYHGHVGPFKVACFG